MSAAAIKTRARRLRKTALTAVREEPVVAAAPSPALCGREAARWEARAFPVPAVLDLTRVERIDAAGVLAVLRTARRARESGRVLRVGGPSPAVRMLLASAGLADLAEVHPTRAQAVAAARAGQECPRPTGRN